MNKNYDQILREKLQGINSTPPAGLWSKIEASLPAADATAAFDQVVKEKMTGMVSNPPPGLWAKIGGAIHGVPFYKTTLFRWSAAAVFLISSFIGWNLLDENQGTISNSVTHKKLIEKPVNRKIQKQKEAVPSVNIATATPKAIGSDNSRTVISKTKTGVSILSANKKNVKATAEQALKLRSSSDIPEKLIIEKQVVTSSSEMDDLSGQHQIEKVNPIGPVEVKVDKTGDLAVTNNELISDTLESGNIDLITNEKIQQQNSSEVIAVNTNQGSGNQEATTQVEDNTNGKNSSGTLPRNPRNLNKYGIQINYTPTYVNTSVNIIDKQDFSLSFAYQNLNFIADLGFGVGFSSEKNFLKVDYLHYEFVKTQFVTDSLSFVFDPNTQSFIPVAVGHQEKVYDDVKYSFSSEVTTNYTYLNIPFNAGYLKEFKYFDLMAKGGINYSMIISKFEKGGFVPDEHTTIVSEDYSSRTRFQSNITYSLAFGGALNIHKNLKLTGEIIGGYYQNSVYSNIDYRPYSYGVRFGLIYFVQ